MPDNIEVIIVGGGPAGLSTALFLAHTRPDATNRILVLEKDRYPREKFCAGGLCGRGDRILSTVGVIVDVPSVPIAGISLRLAAGDMTVRGSDVARVVRRDQFDHALAKVAERRGIRIIEGAKATRMTVERDGCEIETTAGVFRAKVVVGADGVGSFVRRAMGLPAGRMRAQVIEVDTEPVATDVARDLFHFDVSDAALAGYVWDFPTLVDGTPLVCRGIYQLRMADDEGPAAPDPFMLLESKLAARGLSLRNYRVKRFAERGFDVHQPYAARRVLLVGEAAGVDPVTGEGIPQAIQYGAFAGPYLARKLDEDDLSFSDFTRRLEKSRLGRDLAFRSRIARYYFGPYRPAFERFIVRTPSFLSAGLELVAGRPVPRSKVAMSALSAAWHWTLGIAFRG